MKPRTRTILGEPSWILATRDAEVAVTMRGGHMAPVTFFRDTARPVRPYYVSEWQGRNVKTGVTALDVLRGDFFCMPFGSDNRYRGEDHVIHGEPAGSRWTLLGLGKRGRIAELRLGLKTKIRPGHITKSLMLVEGESAVYCAHELSGYSGPMCFSHHAILAVPEDPGSLRVSVSPFRLGRVAPRASIANSGNEYYLLAPGRRFTSLERVPTIWRDIPSWDCSQYPLPYGFVDVLAVFPRIRSTPAWTAAAVPSLGYLWYSLRDPRVLPQTVFWMINGGRHGAPWSGITRALGLEDGCGYFASGLKESAGANDLNDAGIPTSRWLVPARLMRITSIQGVVRIPRSFDRVSTIEFRKGGLVIRSRSGQAVEAAVSWGFVHGGSPSGET